MDVVASGLRSVLPAGGQGLLNKKGGNCMGRQSNRYGPEHDACGIGAVVSIKGIKTYETVDNALKIVEKLEHRAGQDASGETGDGVGQLRQFYADLTDPDCESALALVHSRFSTNTTPNWERAHPNRFILHNGEINTIRGNVDRMPAREETMESAVISPGDMDKLLPVVDPGGSDSAMLDNTLEFLLMNGIDLPKAVMMCITEP